MKKAPPCPTVEKPNPQHQPAPTSTNQHQATPSSMKRTSVLIQSAPMACESWNRTPVRLHLQRIYKPMFLAGIRTPEKNIYVYMFCLVGGKQRGPQRSEKSKGGTHSGEVAPDFINQPVHVHMGVGAPPKVRNPNAEQKLCIWGRHYLSL